MGQDIMNKILKVYFENPDKSFTIRELSSKTKVPRSTLHKKLKLLRKEGFLTKDNFLENNLFVKTKKMNYYVEEIIKSGLVGFLVENLNPSCIILFGSIRKGDSTKESDIDIFIESSLKSRLDLSKYERKLGHKISLFVESDMKNLNSNLFNNVVNGIKLFGSFKIK
jgi:predicted nucleotidyltransferase